MLFRKGTLENDGDLQNQFTAYLVRAVHRKRSDFIDARMRRMEHEIPLDLPEYFRDAEATDILLDERIDREPLSFSDMSFENERLENALHRLSDRDRYVLFARAIAERSFEELAAETGLSYKGVAAIYYRAIGKLKKELEVSEYEIP